MKKLIFITGSLLLLFFFSSCSKDSADYLNDGIKDYESGDYESAVANLRRAKYLMPESFEANVYLGKSFLKTPKVKDAEYKARYYLNAAKELARTNEERFNVKLSLLSIYEKQKDYSKINKECRSLVEEDKKLLDKKKAYELYTMLANSFFNMDEYKEASETYEYIIENFQEELQNDPEVMAKTYLQLGASVVKVDKAHEEIGLSYANTTVKHEKESFSDNYKASASKCYVIFGDHFHKKKAYEISKEYYVKALTYYNFLNDNDNANDISGRIEKIKIEIDKLCDTYDCLMRKGEREMADMDYDDAVDFFKKAEQKGDSGVEKAEAISKLGLSYFLDGNEEDALSRFKILKNKYEKEYKKSIDKNHIDLFMGTSLILTSKKPDTFTRRLIAKASEIISKIKKDGKDDISVFNDNIDLGKKLVESATNNITEKTPDRYIREAAEVCERIGDRFEVWEFKEDAKRFYQKASEYYAKLFEKDKAIALNKKISKLN